MSEKTKNKILSKAARLVATKGTEGISMRTLAKETNISASVLYHYFENKDDLLKQMFDFLGKDLGKKRSKLKDAESASLMLKQRINFQLENAEAIVAVLKYYFEYRNSFKKEESGYIPKRAYLHILEVLKRGSENNEFNVQDINKEAKVITHAINGFVLEYYPAEQNEKEKEDITETIHSFLIRALKN